jgi:hypothetical protein
MMTDWSWTSDRLALYRELDGVVLYVQALAPGRWTAAVERETGRYTAVRTIDRKPRTRHGAMCRAHKMKESNE